MTTGRTLTNADVDAIASRVRDLLVEARRESPALVDAANLARRFGLTRAYVYEHADELGAIRLGPEGEGKRPRLRFDPDVVAQVLARRRTIITPPPRKHARPRAQRASGELLPIRGAAFPRTRDGEAA